MLININGTATNTTATASDVQAVTRIQDLYDVSIPNALADGQLLIYDTGINNWINGTEIVDLTLSNLLTSQDINVNNLLTSQDINVNNLLTSQDINVNNLLTTQDATITGQTRSHTFRADADMNNEFKFYTTWENYGVTDYDVTTSLSTFKDLSNGRLAVNRWKTEAGNIWYRFSALDTGGGDDGSHNTELELWGDAPVIKGNAGNLKVDANHIHTNSVLTMSSSEFAGYEGEMLLTIFSDSGGGVLNAVTLKTPNAYPTMRFRSEDTGGGDDNSHNSRISLFGGNQYINGIGNLEIQANSDLTLISNNDLTLNAGNNLSATVANGINFNTDGRSKMYLGNILTFDVGVDYQQQNANVNIIRQNNTGGNVVEAGSQIQYTFNIASEDNSVDAQIGSLKIGRAHV